MSTTLTIRLDEATKKKIEELAVATRRSKSFLAAEAVREYVETERSYLEHINAGMRDIENGDVVPHAEVEKWVRSWGTKNELPRPRPRKSKR
jgi:predicted transcriptional regulator